MCSSRCRSAAAEYRGDLLFEAILLCPGEVARRDGEVRVQAHPAVAELADEVVDRRLLRGRCGEGEKTENSDAHRVYRHVPDCGKV